MTRSKRWAWAAGLAAGFFLAGLGVAMASSWYSYDMSVPILGGDVWSIQTRTMYHAPTAYLKESYASGGGTIWYAVAYEDYSQLTPFYAVSPNDQQVDLTGSSQYLKDGYSVKLEAQSGSDYLIKTTVEGTWNP